jgi:hypothetical protein
MNERIKELWEESTGSVWPRPGKFTAGEYDHNLEKFVQLIVEEIANFVDAHEQVDRHGEAYEIVYGSDIRRVFGVK